MQHQDFVAPPACAQQGYDGEFEPPLPPVGPAVPPPAPPPVYGPPPVCGGGFGRQADAVVQLRLLPSPVNGRKVGKKNSFLSNKKKK